MKNFLIAVICLLCVVTGVAQQKFGYINSTQLILSLDEIKSADENLRSYQGQLIKKGEEMVRTFETRYNEYLKRVNEGDLSQIEMQQREGELAREQQEIQSYESQVQELLAQRKQSLYQPILDRVQKVVNDIGKENGYTMIFDAGIGGILYAMEGEDVMPLVRERLNLK